MNNKQGFTFLELLVAMAVFTIIASVSISYFISSSKLMQKDTNRVTTGQNAQTALDLMAADIRQAGENLNTDKELSEVQISGVEFSNTPAQNGKDEVKEIIVRKGFSDSINLPHPITGKIENFSVNLDSFCDIRNNQIILVDDPDPNQTPANPFCFFEDSEKDGIDREAQKARSLFEFLNGVPQVAIIYNEEGSGNKKIIKDSKRILLRKISSVKKDVFNKETNIAEERLAYIIIENLSDSHLYNSNSRVKLIDENRYLLNNNELKLAKGSQKNDEAQAVAYNIQDLKINAELKNSDGSYELKESLGFTSEWRKVKKINLEIVTGSENPVQGKNKTFKSEIFIRNALGGPRRK